MAVIFNLLWGSVGIILFHEQSQQRLISAEEPFFFYAIFDDIDLNLRNSASFKWHDSFRGYGRGYVVTFQLFIYFHSAGAQTNGTYKIPKNIYNRYPINFLHPFSFLHFPLTRPNVIPFHTQEKETSSKILQLMSLQ